MSSFLATPKVEVLYKPTNYEIYKFGIPPDKLFTPSEWKQQCTLFSTSLSTPSMTDTPIELPNSSSSTLPNTDSVPTADLLGLNTPEQSCDNNTVLQVSTSLISLLAPEEAEKCPKISGEYNLFITMLDSLPKLKSYTEFENLKEIVCVLSETILLLKTEKFESHRFISDLYTIAISKLDHRSIVQPFNESNRDKTLKGLCGFLSMQMTIQLVKELPTNAIAKKRCTLCSSYGHIASKCFSSMIGSSKFCYCCFKRGHQSATCTTSQVKKYIDKLHEEQFEKLLLSFFDKVLDISNVEDDSNCFKKLFVAVSQARTCISMKNFRFESTIWHDHIFALAFSMLPELKRGLYFGYFKSTSHSGKFEGTASLENLITFLENEIKNNAVTRNIAEDAEVKRKGILNPLQCFYCHKLGHVSMKCRERFALLCIKCFSFGHVYSKCSCSELILNND